MDRAVATYKELLKLNDTNPHYYYALAETSEKGKQLDSAETYVHKGMQLQRPILAKGFLALSGLARERNDLKSALDRLKNAHKEEPNNAFVLYSLCALADRYDEDSKIALRYYVDYLKRFGAKKTFYT